MTLIHRNALSQDLVGLHQNLKILFELVLVQQAKYSLSVTGSSLTSEMTYGIY